MKNKIAVFIGGPFDLTKKTLEYQQEYIDFFEPVNVDYKKYDESTVPCRIVQYTYLGETKQGTLVYAFSKYKE